MAPPVFGPWGFCFPFFLHVEGKSDTETSDRDVAAGVGKGSHAARGGTLGRELAGLSRGRVALALALVLAALGRLRAVLCTALLAALGGLGAVLLATLLLAGLVLLAALALTTAFLLGPGLDLGKLTGPGDELRKSGVVRCHLCV